MKKIVGRIKAAALVLPTLISIVNVAVILPFELVPVTVYEVAPWDDCGDPVIIPETGSSDKPLGKSGETVKVLGMPPVTTGVNAANQTNIKIKWDKS
jgi:hypothetical protein